MARATRPEPRRGEVYGAFTVLREAPRKHGARRFTVRAICCGREMVKQHSDLLRRSRTCVSCKSNGKGAPSLGGRHAGVQP